MKAILMSIRPEWVVKILNGEKTIEIRKKFPKDYVGWVYIYCTKQNDLFKSYIRMGYYTTRSTADDLEYNGKGKVVARFWCDKVEEMYYCDEQYLKPSCLSIHEMFDYLKDKSGYAIHITKLEIFDKPKEINEFWNNGKKVKGHNGTYQYSKLTRAPQSWQFIEV